MVTYEQDEAGVNITLKVGEVSETVRAKFLLGTDGGKGARKLGCVLQYDADGIAPQG